MRLIYGFFIDFERNEHWTKVDFFSIRMYPISLVWLQCVCVCVSCSCLDWVKNCVSPGMSQYLYCQCCAQFNCCTIDLLWFSLSLSFLLDVILLFPCDFSLSLFWLSLALTHTHTHFVSLVVRNEFVGICVIRLHITDPLTVNYYSMIMLIVIVSISLSLSLRERISYV